ncbi:MAG: winged helix-turn-helix transcriptional regulator [Candidatus Andersenbacteria bacterium]|nr:winged helix-turn-helix transcriptional regulator [Candidatus Andersenbacteria bacterium]
MAVNRVFPLEKIFGSRTRVKIIALFTTGVKRPYFVREISRTVNERLNAVRRELDILLKFGMLNSYDDKRRKYYVINDKFALFDELSSIMKKAGPGVEDVLFKNIEAVGDIKYACLTGYFTGVASAPTDLFIIGTLHEKQLDAFIRRIEMTINREITYTPMTETEYKYRKNFNDMFLRQIFSQPYKELVNHLSPELQPTTLSKKQKVQAQSSRVL